MQTSVNEKVMRLYNEGVLLEDIQKTLKLPVKSIVNIIFKAKSDEDPLLSKSVMNKKSNWYIYFCEFLYEGKTLREIIAGRSLNEDTIIEMIGNVLKMEKINSDTKDEVITKLAKELGESKANTAKRVGLEYKQSFTTALKRIWR